MNYPREFRGDDDGQLREENRRVARYRHEWIELAFSWADIARLLHRRCVQLREKLACELAISQRISGYGVTRTEEMQAWRKRAVAAEAKVIELRETLARWLPSPECAALCLAGQCPAGKGKGTKPK